jgi:hypothetical protein
MHLLCVYFVLCLGSDLEASSSLAQGVLSSVKNDYGTEYEAWAVNGLEEPLKIIAYTKIVFTLHL